MLLGAALLFWGWQTGFLFLALPLAILIEAARALTWRLELSATDFHRLTDLCTLLIVVSGIYLFSTTGTSRATDGPRAMTLLFQWLPLLLFPLIASQLYSTAGKVPLTAFFWALRRQAARAPETRPVSVDLGYLYFALCILAASAANRRTLEFYAGLCTLAGWALWPWRSRRFSPLWWIPMLGIAAVAGYAGHVALHRAQQVVEQTVFEYIFSMVRGDADPFRVTTAIGHLGRLKLSDRTVLRVERRDGLHVPFLLREASYDVYNSPAWLAAREGRDGRGVLPPELPLFDLEGRAAAQGVGARGVPAELTRRALRVLCHRDDLAAACGRRPGALRGRLLGPGVEPSRATLHRARAPRPFVDPRVRHRRLARRGHDASGLGRRRAERGVVSGAGARLLVVGRVPPRALALERGRRRHRPARGVAPDPAGAVARLASLLASPCRPRRREDAPGCRGRAPGPGLRVLSDRGASARRRPRPPDRRAALGLDRAHSRNRARPDPRPPLPLPLRPRRAKPNRASRTQSASRCMAARAGFD